MIITGKYPKLRMRRSRKTDWMRRLVRENSLSSNDFILPIFVTEGKNKKIPIKTMPEVYRYSEDKLSQIVDRALKLKIPMIAIFPQTNNILKDSYGSEALNENNLVCKAIRKIKDKYKNLSAYSFTTYNNELVISFDGFANQDDIIEFADFVFAKIKMRYWHTDKVPTFH